MKRNCSIFFRDKPSVFFSMLGVLIVLLLYVLFLRNLMVGGNEMPGGEFLMDSWIMAGMLAVAAVTASLGSFGILINDKVTGSAKTMNVSPATPVQVTAGYIMSSFVISLILSLITLFFAELYIAGYGGQLLSFMSMLEVLGVVLLGTMSGCALMFFIVSFLKTANAFATLSTIIGTLIGFVAGVYIPIGNMPEAVQMIIKVMPVSHEASLLRQIFMEVPEQISFAGASAEELHQFNIDMGVIFEFGGADFPVIGSILILIGTTVLFLALSAWNLSRKHR